MSSHAAPTPSHQRCRRQGGVPHLARLSAKRLQLIKARGWGLTVRGAQAHLGERVEHGKQPGLRGRHDVPGSAAGLHGVIDGGAALAHHVAVGIAVTISSLS